KAVIPLLPTWQLEKFCWEKALQPVYRYCMNHTELADWYLHRMALCFLPAAMVQVILILMEEILVIHITPRRWQMGSSPRLRTWGRSVPNCSILTVVNFSVSILKTETALAAILFTIRQTQDLRSPEYGHSAFAIPSVSR